VKLLPSCIPAVTTTACEASPPLAVRQPSAVAEPHHVASHEVPPTRVRALLTTSAVKLPAAQIVTPPIPPVFADEERLP